MAQAAVALQRGQKAVAQPVTLAVLERPIPRVPKNKLPPLALRGVLATTFGCRIQVPLLRKASRAKAHIEDARSRLIFAAGHSVSIRQLGAHDWVAPVGLLRPLGMDGPGFGQRVARFGLTYGLSRCMGAHDALPSLRGEAIEGLQEGLAAEVGAKVIDITVACISCECSRD